MPCGPLRHAAHGRCSGSRGGRSTCRSPAPSARPAGSAGSSSARTGTSRPSSPCAESAVPAARVEAASRSPPRGLPACSRRARFSRAPAYQSRSTPRRCRSCRAGRSRWRGTTRRARSTRSRPRAGSAIGNSPCQVLAICRPSGAARHPTRTPRRRGRRAPRTPTPPRSAGPCRPSGERLHVVVGDVHDRVSSRPAASCGRAGARQSAPGTIRPPVEVVAQVDAPGGLRKTTDDGTSSSGSRSRVVRRVGRALRERHVAGRFDEAAELGVGDRRAVNPEGADATRCAGASSG